MSPAVKRFSISYDAINEYNTFSSGDFITGRVIMEISKETKIGSLSVKAKGEADVHWTESNGDTDDSYYASERYFKLKEFIIRNPKGDGKDCEKLLTGESRETYPNVVGPGVYVYPFTFHIPQRDMPSSFKGVSGKILYTLEAKLSRSMRMAKTAGTEFTFITKDNMVDDTLLASQSGSVKKKMKIFTSGNVSMIANMGRTGYVQGERLNISVEVENKSSRGLVPKFSLDQTQTFIASTSTCGAQKRIFKEVGEAIPSSTQQMFTKELCIPPDLQPSILNCSIIKVEYILKVYLDVPYARDPEIKFPVVIVPAAGGFAQMIQPNTSIGF